jgi:hypothetical protein
LKPAKHQIICFIIIHVYIMLYVREREFSTTPVNISDSLMLCRNLYLQCCSSCTLVNIKWMHVIQIMEKCHEHTHARAIHASNSGSIGDISNLVGSQLKFPQSLGRIYLGMIQYRPCRCIRTLVCIIV